MLDRETIAKTEARILNNSGSQNRNNNSIISESNNESTPRNQSYISQATEHAKNFLFPENDNCKYPYPEEVSTDNLNNNNKINSTSNQNTTYNTNQNKSNLNNSKKSGNYTYGSMVDSVITDKDVEESERRIHELAAEKRRGSISKSGQSSSIHNKNNNNSNSDTNKGGFMSKLPFGHRKSKSEETNNSNNLNKKTYSIPDENQYINQNYNNNIDNDDINNNNSKFSNQYNTVKDENLKNNDFILNRDNVDIKNRSNDYNSNINFGNNMNAKGASNYTKTSNNYDSEIDPNTEIYEGDTKQFKNNQIVDDGKYKKNYEKGLNYENNNNSERTYVSNADIYARDKNSKLAGREYFEEDNVNNNKYNSNLYSNYDTYTEDHDNNNDNKNNDESLLTKLKNYITGNEKQDESNESNDLVNDPLDSKYNKNKDSLIFDDLTDDNNNNKNNDYSGGTSENMGSNLAFVSNPNIYHSKRGMNKNCKNIESDFNPTQPLSNNNQQYQNIFEFDQNKGISTLDKPNQYNKTNNYNNQTNKLNGLQDVDSNKKDITTDMFTDSEPYRMVQNQDDKAYLKSEYSKGLKVNEKRSNLIDKNELDPAFQSEKYSKNKYTGNITGGTVDPNDLNYSNKSGIDKPDLNKRNFGETGVISKNYDGYYAGTKTKTKDNHTSLNQNPISYNLTSNYSRETKIKSGNDYNSELNHNNNNITNQTTSDYNKFSDNMRTNEPSQWESYNVISNDPMNFTNSSYGNKAADENSHGDSKKIDYNDNSNYVKADYNKLAGTKEPTQRYNKDPNYSVIKNNQMGKNNNYNSDKNKATIAGSKQTELVSETGGFVKGKDGIYEYEDLPAGNTKGNKFETGNCNDTDHTKSKESEHKGLNKIKNLFTSKDKKTKKDVQKTNIGEHGTVYQPTDNRISTNSETVGNKNYVNSNSPTNREGETIRDVDYSTSAANKSYNNYTSTHNKNSNVLNKGNLTETPPDYKENNYGVGQAEHHRKKSLIENIKDAF